MYFPPQGQWNFAGSAIKITIDKRGVANFAEIVEPPLVRGKRSARAELCLRSAVENVNPLESPPKEMKLPARFLVKFIPQSKSSMVFRCVAKRL